MTAHPFAWSLHLDTAQRQQFARELGAALSHSTDEATLTSAVDEVTTRWEQTAHEGKRERLRSQTYAEMARLADEDLGGEPDDWGFDDQGAVVDLRPAVERTPGGAVALQGVPETLRATLAVVAPERLEEFDTQHGQAVADTAASVSFGPLLGFCVRWADTVCMRRHPDLAARMRALGEEAHVCADRARAHEIANEMGRIIDIGHREAGLRN